MSTDASAVRKSPFTSFDSRVSTFNRTLSNKGAHPSLLHKFPTQAELDSYPIALIPSRVPGDRIPPIGTQYESIRQLLVLPLTWADFVQEIRAERTPRQQAEAHDDAQFGDIRIDFLTLEAWRSDRPVEMTAMDFKVLKFFTSNPRRVISRASCSIKCGVNNYPTTRTVDNRIMRLRQKLEIDAANPIHFRTVHGVGYKFVP